MTLKAEPQGLSAKYTRDVPMRGLPTYTPEEREIIDKIAEQIKRFYDERYQWEQAFNDWHRR